MQSRFRRMFFCNDVLHNFITHAAGAYRSPLDRWNDIAVNPGLRGSVGGRQAAAKGNAVKLPKLPVGFADVITRHEFLCI